MPYENLTSRTDAAALIPEEVSTAFLGGAEEQSAVLTSFTRVPALRRDTRFPVLSALPMAYWVNGDTGLKQTTEMAWANKYMTAEELAAIAPIPDSVAEDTDIDVWAEIRPGMQSAIAVAIDAAVFFGVNKPASFPDAIDTAARAAGNVATADSAAAAGGIQNDLDETIGLVEEDGYDVSAIFGARGMRGRLRRARNAQGDRLTGVNDALTEYLGTPISYPTRTAWAAYTAGGGDALAYAIDGSQFVVGVRREMSFAMHTDGVIQRPDGTIAYNLLQQDMSAMKVTFRAGWQVANRITPERPGAESTRYPAAVLDAV